MKRRIKIMIATGLLLAAAVTFGCLSGGDAPAAGIAYEGSAMGYRGIIRVRVNVDRGIITDITVLESSEDRNIGGQAIEELIDQIYMDNSTDVDAVSGATETSKGFLAAIENALMKDIMNDE